ncbi:MAG: ribbon-helix-helix domain-containing protein [Parvularculaceae bacterium]
MAIKKRSISLKGHRTSIALEPEFWAALEAIAAEDGKTLPALVNAIDRNRLKMTPPPGLASSLRVFVLTRLQNAG